MSLTSETYMYVYVRVGIGRHKSDSMCVMGLELSFQKQRYLKLGQASDRLIRDILPIGTDFGIVTFSDDAQVRCPMTELTGDAARNTVASSLPTKVDFYGLTAIAKGLDVALQVEQHYTTL